MTEKEKSQFIYQVTATQENGDGSTLRARLSMKPFHIGSSDNADMRLEDDEINPVHVRLLITTTGQVMIANLGAPGSVSLDGDMMLAYTPSHWKPGSPVQLGSYRLMLDALIVDGGQLEQVRPAVVTQNNEVVEDAPVPQYTVMFTDQELADESDESPPQNLNDEAPESAAPFGDSVVQEGQMPEIGQNVIPQAQNEPEEAGERLINATPRVPSPLLVPDDPDELDDQTPPEIALDIWGELGIDPLEAQQDPSTEEGTSTEEVDDPAPLYPPGWLAAEMPTPQDDDAEIADDLADVTPGPPPHPGDSRAECGNAGRIR